jgi:hypothetical protein
MLSVLTVIESGLRGKMGGYSYQDMETRLTQIEDKLHFVMTALRMKGIIGNGLVGPDGQPTGKVIDQTLLDWYRLVKQQVLDVVATSVSEAGPLPEAGPTNQTINAVAVPFGAVVGQNG